VINADMQDQTGRCEAIIRGSHFIYYEYLFYFHSTIIKLHCIMGTCISSQIAHKINQNLATQPLTSSFVNITTGMQEDTAQGHDIDAVEYHQT